MAVSQTLKKVKAAPDKARLSCQLGKLLNAGSRIARELFLSDHVGFLYPIQCGFSRSERLNPAHVPHAPFDDSVILFKYLDLIDCTLAGQPNRSKLQFISQKETSTYRARDYRLSSCAMNSALDTFLVVHELRRSASLSQPTYSM